MRVEQVTVLSHVAAWACHAQVLTVIAFRIGCLPSVGSLRSCFFFANEPYKSDYVLQKRLIILRSLLIVATP